MAVLFSSPLSHLSHLPTLSPHSSCSSSCKTHLTHKPYLSLTHHKPLFLALPPKAQNDVASTVTVDDKPAENQALKSSKSGTEPVSDSPVGQHGSATARFADPRWVRGTWDLKLFQKEGKTNWDAVIDAEVCRRKWLEENPEASSTDEPVVFDTAIIPWWAWMKRFHLPEAEKLNGRAAMIGFFMAYLVDSLTGLGLVDQMGNVVCRTLLFVAVAGVLLVRKNEDVEALKKLVEETTLYDKQWKAIWKDDETTESFKTD